MTQPRMVEIRASPWMASDSIGVVMARREIILSIIMGKIKPYSG